MAAKDAPTPSRVDQPAYTYQDAQAFAHLASITRLLNYRDAVVTVQFASQLREFAPSEDARVAKLIKDVTEIRAITASAMETLTEISNSLIARPFQVEAIERELHSGPWQGGDAESVTYPNGVPVDPDDLVGREMRVSVSEISEFQKAGSARLASEPPVPSPNTD